MADRLLWRRAATVLAGPAARQLALQPFLGLLTPMKTDWKTWWAPLGVPRPTEWWNSVRGACEALRQRAIALILIRFNPDTRIEALRGTWTSAIPAPSAWSTAWCEGLGRAAGLRRSARRCTGPHPRRREDGRQTDRGPQSCDRPRFGRPKHRRAQDPGKAGRACWSICARQSGCGSHLPALRLQRLRKEGCPLDCRSV